MIPYIGDFAEDATVYHYFNTFDSNDPSASVTITNLASTDLFVHKDGVDSTETTTGATVDVDFDTQTGIHKITVDTSADAFYAIGSDYMVRMVGTTIDGATVNAALFTFSIENRYNDVNVVTVSGTAQTANDNGADINTLVTGVNLNAGAITNASLAGNMEIVFETDFATNYNTTDNAWVTNGTSFIGTGWNTGKTGYSLTQTFPTNFADMAITVTTGQVTVGTNNDKTGYTASTVSDKTGYSLTATTGLGNQTANITGNLTGSVGSVTGAVGSVAGNVDGSVASVVGAVGSVTGAVGSVTNDLSKYSGPRGPGVYLNDAAANTNTTSYTDGIISQPVSTIAAAKTIADALSLDRIYLVNDSAITLAATMNDYEFVGIGAPNGNSVALASQDVDGSDFYNLTITGVQGGTARVKFEDCIIGTATLHLHAIRCGFTDSVTGVTFSNNDDNIMDGCYSMVAGNSSPIFICSGANLDISVRHYSGGLELKTLNATATASIEADGQVIFNADCNTGAAVTMRGNLTITDNTGGMSSLTTGAVYDKRSDIAAVKTVTDQMVFTKANELDVNTQSINGAAVVGDGNATPWDGA